MTPGRSSAPTFEQACERRVTYVLVTMNRAAFLSDALESARSLVGDEDELIVVDGGSTDETADVVARFPDLIDVYVSEPDTGEGHAANRGYLLARGRYVKELTDDDVIHPDAMKQAIEVMDRNPEIDLLVCGGTKGRDGKTQVVWHPEGTGFGQSPNDPLRLGCCGIGWLIRRNLFAKVGLMNPNAISLDVDFTSQAIARGANVRFCRINLYHHEVLEHSTTRARRSPMLEDTLRIARDYADRSTWFRVWANVRAPAVVRLSRLFRRGRKQHSDPSQVEWDGGLS